MQSNVVGKLHGRENEGDGVGKRVVCSCLLH